VRCQVLRSLLGANGPEQVLGSENQILTKPNNADPSQPHIVVVIAPQGMLPVHIFTCVSWFSIFCSPARFMVLRRYTRDVN
jgi:hypothetical protein